MKNYNTFTLGCVLLICACAISSAQPKADFVQGSAYSGSNKINEKEKLNSNAAISTKQKTKVQVSAKSMFVRAGSKTDLFLKERSNELDLRKGVAFVSGHGVQNERTVKLNAGNCRLKSKGSILVSHVPDEYVKVTCIEGTTNIKLTAFLGDSVNLKAGELLVITPTDKRLQNPKVVNLKKLLKTSKLLSGDFPVLPAELTQKMVHSVKVQQTQIAQSNFIPVSRQNPTLVASSDIDQRENAANPCVYRRVEFTFGGQNFTEVFDDGLDGGVTRTGGFGFEGAALDLTGCNQLPTRFVDNGP